MIQVLIYTGAIVVLFVFVVMLLNLASGAIPHSHGWLTVLATATAAWGFCLLLLRTLNHTPFSGEIQGTSMRLVSHMLFNEYLWPFEVLSVFLLALIVAIFALARPDESEGEG
jgi:NADH-quinone oxidoreductase subunit J